MSQSDRDQIDEMRMKRVQLLSGSKAQNANPPPAPPSYQSGFMPMMSMPPFGAAFGSVSFHPSLESPPVGSFSGVPPSISHTLTASRAVPSPYAQGFHHGASTTPSMFGSPSNLPSSPHHGDEEEARRLQALYDAEDLPEPLGPNSSLWPRSPFNSDEEYALSLAVGFDQHSGSPIAPSNKPAPSYLPAAPSRLPSVEADAEYARQLQKELNAGGEQYTYTVRPQLPVTDKLAAMEIDIQTDAVPLHKYGQQILMSECAGCKKHLLYSEKDVIKLTKNWLDKQGKYSKHRSNNLET